MIEKISDIKKPVIRGNEEPVIQNEIKTVNQ